MFIQKLIWYYKSNNGYVFQYDFREYGIYLRLIINSLMKKYFWKGPEIGQSFSTAVYKQKQVIFNQKLINQLALLTGGGALQPHTQTYICMFKNQ